MNRVFIGYYNYNVEVDAWNSYLTVNEEEIQQFGCDYRVASLDELMGRAYEGLIFEGEIVTSDGVVRKWVEYGGEDYYFCEYVPVELLFLHVEELSAG